MKSPAYWSGESEIISVWRQNSEQLQKKSSMGGATILAAISSSPTSIFAIMKRENTFKLVEIDTALHEKELFQIPVETLISSLYFNRTNQKFCFLFRKKNNLIVEFVGKNGEVFGQIEVVGQEPAWLSLTDSLNFSLISSFGETSSLTLFNSTEKFAPIQVFLPAQSRLTAVTSHGVDLFEARYLASDGRGFSVYSSVIENTGKLASPKVLGIIPPEFFQPLSIEIVNEITFALFQNGLVSFDKNGKILSADHLFLPISGNEKYFFQTIGKELFISSQTGSFILEKHGNSFWWWSSLLESVGIYAFGLILIVLIFLAYYKFKNEQRILRTLFDIPNADALLILDNRERLQSLNDSARQLLNIPRSVPLGRLYHFYATVSNTESLEELARDVLSLGSPISRKIVISGTIEREFLFAGIPIQSRFGKTSGVLLTGRDMTAELEKKRLSNWAQLAHDMQTNLSIIRLNAEKFAEDKNRDSSERGKKILYQVNLLINRVSDLVTLGRSEQLEIMTSNAADICLNVRKEFDDALFFNVEFSERTENFLLNCDQPKLERALRNAVENGVRALQGKAGHVEISCRTDGRFAYFSVNDTGVGMNFDVQSNMLKPFFTTNQKQGGTGMGTIIMRHVLELHGGEIIIESQKNYGTTVTFRIPMTREKTINQEKNVHNN